MEIIRKLVTIQKGKRKSFASVDTEHSSTCSTMDLIVDFPQVRRVCSSLPRRVCFADTCDVKYVRRLPDFVHKSTLWYSKQDINLMKIQVLLSAEVLKDKSVAVSQYATTSRDVCTILGLEKLLSDDVTKRISSEKANHRKGVLAEEKRQASLGIYDANAMSSVSMALSEWSTNRATLLAFSQADEDY